MRGKSHDWTEGPFAHPGEKVRRCNPQQYDYSRTTCRDFQKKELSERRSMQGWAELPSSSVIFCAYVGAAVVDAYGDTGSDDKRSEHRASQKVAMRRCIEELRSGVKATLTNASGVGTNIVCGSGAEVKNGADIGSVNDGRDGRRAGGAAGRERAKTYGRAALTTLWT
uniref:AtC3H23-like CCCH zinc finger domain-containing protein n=1 Tax=Physcomitrium patens TaxID=3218 RepID=A0A2K1IHM8_PHYPA|nr:hypothetical protein PHYPA_027476 [Physcomitrium patens]